jgi:hypothetical protein
MCGIGWHVVCRTPWWGLRAEDCVGVGGCGPSSGVDPANLNRRLSKGGSARFHMDRTSA